VTNSRWRAHGTTQALTSLSESRWLVGRRGLAIARNASKLLALERSVDRSIAYTSNQPMSPGKGPAFEYGRALGTRARLHLRGQRRPARLLRCVEDVAETLGFDPYRDSNDAVRLRNCPFDPLSRLYTPLVCGVAQAMLTGVVEGLGVDELTVSREMDPDRCCGVVSTGDRMAEQSA
jgi:hypothetical protein